ncbi:MAG: cytochrome c, partial [Phycisphaerae bacterium]
PPAGEQSGSDTHRCKECHGWDYKGASGAYGSGPHFTGIGGVFGSAMTPEQMFALIAEDGATIQNGHGFAAAGMTEQDIWDVIYFVQELAIDTDLYIDAAGQFLGDAAQAATLYESGPPGAASRVQAAVACGVCHGPDGTAINFGTSSDPEWVGTVAVNDPWQLLHEVRVGLPQGTMMSWLSAGGTDQDVADIGLYAQLTFPVECTTDTHCDDSAFCTGVETCADRFCVPGVDPCPGAVCDETTHTCLSGACAPPLAEAAGSRYLAITPGPIGSAVPQAILVKPQCPGGVARYVGSLRCGGTGAMCRTDADCNTCSFGHNPCLTDADCDFGFCDDGSECSLAAQNCTDMSECVRVDFCELGDACVAGTFATVDVNDDGLPDGLVATLVDDPTDAAFMTPDDWSASVMRCSKSSLPCTVDSDCDHGACSNTGPCSVSAQNCTDGSVCVLDESCMPGRVYVTGEGIVPSDWVGAALAPVTYAVRGDCGTVTNPDVSLPASATMWRWGDANNDVFVNVSDIQLIVLAIQGVYTYSTVATDDLSGRTTCEPQQLINVTDVLMAIRALQGERYIDIACYHPCP